MPQRPPLIDEPDDTTPANKPARKAPDARTMKLVAVGALLVAAAGILAWGMGLFDGGSEPLPEQERNRQRLEQEIEQDARIDANVQGGDVESGG